MTRQFAHIFCILLFALIIVPGKGEYVVKRAIQVNAPVFDSLKSTVRDTIRPRKHRLIAALLAFPLGVFGLHRMYLGTDGGVPALYIVTLGGIFGVLPFIDFVMILLSHDINKTFAHNKHIFMWQKH